MPEMISFRVVKEPYGWAVRLGEGMMTPFPSRNLAMKHANGCADMLRRTGETVEVEVVEETWLPEPIGARRSRTRLSSFFSL